MKLYAVKSDLVFDFDFVSGFIEAIYLDPVNAERAANKLNKGLSKDQIEDGQKYYVEAIETADKRKEDY